MNGSPLSYESSGTGNGARPRSQSAHSRSTMNREEEENLDYWERLRKKSTPIPVLQREMDYFMDTASHRIFGAKKNRLEEEFARRTPKVTFIIPVCFLSFLFIISVE